MAIPGYQPLTYDNGGPPSGDEYYDPALGLPYFSSGNIPEDWNVARKISSHDWVAGVYPPMFRIIRDGTTFLYFGELAVGDIQHLLANDFSRKLTPVMLPPKTILHIPPAWQVHTVGKYRKFFTDDEWDALAGWDLVAALRGVACVDPIDYQRIGGIPYELVKKLNAQSGIPMESFDWEYIYDQDNEKIIIPERFRHASQDPVLMTHLWDYPHYVEVWKILSFKCGKQIIDYYDVCLGTKYFATFIYDDGTESAPSDEMRTYHGDGHCPYITDPKMDGQYFAQPYGLSTSEGVSVDVGSHNVLAVQYIPVGVVKVRYYRYVWYLQTKGQGYPSAGWYLWEETDADDQPLWSS